MAGLGSRFSKEGYKKPKPFIDICGKPMIERVMENLQVANANFILILQKLHFEKYENVINNLRNNFSLDTVTIEKVTEGAACTVLHTAWLVNNDVPLLIANCDQIIDIKIQDYFKDSFTKKVDGSILTFEASDTKWSYAKVDSNGYVKEVKEKEKISDYATVGIYYFRKGKIFISAASKMIANNDRVNNEFYVAPAYNYAIENNYKFSIYNIKKGQMHGIGTPKDLSEYLKIISKDNS